MKLHLTFLLSAAQMQHLPSDLGSEVAFIGASNVGKSSVINAIAGSKKMARVGKTPGVTQLINVFVADKHLRLVDLPGYGYAKVAKTVRENWHQLINCYLIERQSLKGLFLLTDSRHPLNLSDIQLLQWCKEANLPVCILLTKTDKLTRQETMTVLKKVTSECQEYHCQVILLSTVTKQGLKEIFRQIVDWTSISPSTQCL